MRFCIAIFAVRTLPSAHRALWPVRFNNLYKVKCTLLLYLWKEMSIVFEITLQPVKWTKVRYRCQTIYIFSFSNNNNNNKKNNADSPLYLCAGKLWMLRYVLNWMQWKSGIKYPSIKLKLVSRLFVCCCKYPVLFM